MPSGGLWCYFPAADLFSDMMCVDAMSTFDFWGECGGVDLRSWHHNVHVRYLNYCIFLTEIYNNSDIWRGAGSLANTMWPGPRPTCMPSFILIHINVWPQYTNVTDRTDRQDSTGRTDLQMVAQKFEWGIVDKLVVVYSCTSYSYRN